MCYQSKFHSCDTFLVQVKGLGLGVSLISQQVEQAVRFMAGTQHQHHSIYPHHMFLALCPSDQLCCRVEHAQRACVRV